MELISEQEQVDWLPDNARLSLYRIDRLPERELISSVHAFCLEGAKLLFVKHQNRSWDIPGGHLEAGESAEQALKRELLEEAAVQIEQPEPVACLQVAFGKPYPQSLKYPVPISYLVIYKTYVKEMLEFAAHYETTERKFFTVQEISELDWVKRNRSLFEFLRSEIFG